MHPYRDSTPTKIALAIFFISIVIYAYFEARGILFGPTIDVAQSIEQVSDPYVELTGTTSHIVTLSVNGQNVPVTEQGGFDIPFVLSSGYNRIVLDATDKYGHATQKIIQIIYTPATSTLAKTGISTAATSSALFPAVATSTRL